MEKNDMFAFYDLRIRKMHDIVRKCKKREKNLSYSRLISFITGFLLFAFLYSYSPVVAGSLLAGFLLLFGYLIKYHNKLIHYREMQEYLIEINEKEKSCLEGKFLQFPDGARYVNKDHRYSFDLDIFGRNSLYQMINRTTSMPASDLLAEWLTCTAVSDEISYRQQAVSELKDKIEWRQQLQAFGYLYREAGNNPDEILQWIDSPNMFLHLRYLRPLSFVLSVLTVSSAFAVFLSAPASMLLLFLVLNFVLNFIHQKKVKTLHNQVSKSSDMLSSYSGAISLIETEAFTASKLVALQSCFNGEKPASGLIRKLSQLVHRLDTRLNIMVSAVLNLFFFWDLHLCFMLERWKENHATKITDWFSAMAEIEVLSSFANLQANNPDWVMPQVREGNFHLHVSESGHPLIPNNRRVCNDLRIPGPGKMLLITGSNMSGKSTFLRTIGVNMVLAFAGSPVCASYFKVGAVRLITSMRVSDSLEDNTSTFYAELKRLAMIIKESKNNQSVFLLLDEILHGTNSNDRHTGSVALLKQLLKYGATSMAATHDLGLSYLEKEHPEYIINYNFDVKIKGEELYFDYKLNKGVCRSMNASVLMKKMGIEM